VLENLIAPIEGCYGDKMVMRRQGSYTTKQALLEAMRKVPFLELRTEPFKAPSEAGRSGQVSNPAPFLRTRSAYAMFRSIEVSDYEPTELIEIVSPSQQAAIADMPWNDGQQFHLFTFQQYCAPGAEISPRKCKELREIYQGQSPLVRDAMDRQICAHGRHIVTLAEHDPANDRLRDRLGRWTQICGKYTFTNSETDPSIDPAPLLTMSEDDTTGPTALTEERRAEEQLLRKQRRYVLVVSSSTLPPETFASVNVGDNYYYIAKDDNISQRNFRLLSLISTIQAVAPTAPLTPTVSVGGH
jgi:hypothetical protein